MSYNSDLYKDMCIAAKLNYYRKMPTIEYLQKLSGLSEDEFNDRVQLNLDFLKSLMNDIHDRLTSDALHILKDMSENINMAAICIAMMESKQLIWYRNTWISREEFVDKIVDE